MTFTFDPIALPDSTVNELASHGFVKFKISPKKNLPAGTIIENDATIYFDFNDPIITNQTFHTIWEESVFEVLTTIDYMENTGVRMIVYPNPFSQSATVQFDHPIDGAKRFELYDVLGKLVYKKTSFGASFEISSEGLTKGVYFFAVHNNNKVIGKGKLVVN